MANKANALQGLMKTKAQAVSLAAETVTISPYDSSLTYPLLITPLVSDVDLAKWVNNNKTLLKDNLSTYGALLFRNFSIDTADSFRTVFNLFCEKSIEYKDRTSPRTDLGSNLYTSTDHPPGEYIHMHTESSYSFIWALKIAFYCLQPPTLRGETPIADVRNVLKLLSDDVRDRFLKKGVLYRRTMSKHIGLSWQEVYQTENRAEVEAKLSARALRFSGKGAMC